MQLKKTNAVSKSVIKPVEEPVDDLILKRIGGGSIINHRPLFSNDGEILYVVWKQVIRAYSAQTGDFVKELEPADHKIINITLLPEKSDTIIGCTDNAELVQWNSENGHITIKTKLLSLSKSNRKIKTFHMCQYKTGNEKNVHALVSFIDGMDLHIETYDVELGKQILHKKLDNFKEDYYLDIIANYGENLIGIAQNSSLFILHPKEDLKIFCHKIGRDVTCIAGHPQEPSVATGDSSGRILVWTNVTHHQPIRSTFHWHTLPVTDVIFSRSGGHMYSGGGECVLVKWALSNPGNKSFLPRLPAPIRHLTISSKNIYVAVSTVDNGIIIVNPQKIITAVIQNFTWGVASSKESLFPAGITVDPRTNSLVLNSRTGHIQFYNPHTKSLLYNINITSRNFLTQERTGIIVNTEVTKVAINDDGTWMATVEERDDHVSHIEVRLKFWKFNMEKQSFILNTSVESPHEIGVNSLKFRPKSIDMDQYVITVGKDNKFKVWTFEDTVSKYWKYYSIGEYRNLPALDAGFSTDGSIIGVGFQSTLSLWVPETMELKKCLCSNRYTQPISRVEFGKQELCHLVVTASTEHLAVWDTLSFTVKWSVPVNLSLLVADSLSTYMAVFTTDNNLFVFSPDNANLVYNKKNILEKNITTLGACFVPNLQVNEKITSQWQKKSQLFFLDSEQELLTLESKSESSIVLEHLTSGRNLPLTIFNRMKAAEKTTNVEKPISSADGYLKVNKGAIEEFLNAPAHVLPPMRILCKPFLLSLMGKYDDKDSNDKSSRSTTDVEKQDSFSEKSTTAISYWKKNIENKDVKNLPEKPSSGKRDLPEHIELNWSFLSSSLESKPPEFNSW